MRLIVEHSTFFEYSEPVREAATEVRLQPNDNQMTAQRCLCFRLRVQPVAPIYEYTDCYGNGVHHFTIVPSHSSLYIVASSTVETATGALAADEGGKLQAFGFLHESRYVHFDSSVRQFAEQFRHIESPWRLGEAICERIKQVLIYEPGVTGVHSTSAEVMALGRGVCQDFAQLMIATCRYLGVASRYISGYVYNGPESEGTDQASHAWCEIYGGADVGWLGFDPTHATVQVDERYVRVAAGRDYADVPPVRGVYKGNATEKMRVAVRISADPG